MVYHIIVSKQIIIWRLTMRTVPQILRYYLVMNTIRTMEIDSLLDHCDNYPQLLHCKRMLCHDKASGEKQINHYIDELANRQFHFKYKSRKEQGADYDPTAIWEEDIAGAKYTNWELIKVLRELRMWLQQQKPYRYPAEING